MTAKNVKNTIKKTTTAKDKVVKPVQAQDTSGPTVGSSADTGAGSPAPGTDGGTPESENQNLPSRADGEEGESAGEAPAAVVCATDNPAVAAPEGENTLSGGASGEEEAPECDRIIVASKVDGFRRAGRAWSREAVTLSIDEFTEEQIEALCTDPMLEVAFIAKGV